MARRFLCPSKRTCFSLPHVRPIIRYVKLSFTELILMNRAKCVSNIQIAFIVSKQSHWRLLLLHCDREFEFQWDCSFSSFLRCSVRCRKRPPSVGYSWIHSPKGIFEVRRSSEPSSGSKRKRKVYVLWSNWNCPFPSESDVLWIKWQWDMMSFSWHFDCPQQQYQCSTLIFVHLPWTV